jgi:DNA primase catalytic core
MSLHRITAGSGYDYLTRQVAAMDSTERGHTALASYYTEKGEIPGRWIGSGMAGIEGLDVGDLVTAEQMQSLFGSGHHPLAAQRAAALAGNPDATRQDVLDAIRLGQPFKVYAGDISPYRIEVARRLEALNKANGRPAKVASSVEDRARIRTEVGLEFFRRDFGRAPLDQRELAGHIARLSRQQTTAVAGFDLTFSPVKSVSALWALADPKLAAAIETAHQAAVADALAFIEKQVLFTRTGTNGVRQVEVRGLVATAFTHRDSRAGDPDLHTHVAVANKVQTVADGRWLSIDSRLMHKAITTASETYNTALEAHLNQALGVRFEARAGHDPGKRPVREIVGVEPQLLARWSSRRRRIFDRQAELAGQFQRDHGRPPTPVEAIVLAQQATLETREAKHEPRTLAEQRALWHTQAVGVLGDDFAIQRMVLRALHPASAAGPALDRAWFEDAAARILARVEQDRSTWQSWHVRSEALRLVRGAGVPPASTEAVVNWLTNQVLTQHSLPLTTDDDGITEPPELRRSDGASVYTVAGNRLYTSQRIIDAEQRLIEHAGRRDGRGVPEAGVDLALLQTAAEGVELNAGQALLVRDMASSGARLQLAIAPAGSGKTTAMQALSRAWTIGGGTVIGLAPSAVAAAGLGEQIGSTADTIAKLAWHLEHGGAPRWVNQIGPKTLVIIDEAGMADTLSLDTVVTHILDAGGSVRLIGDDQQLAAIGAGGVLRDIEASHGAPRLSELVRFADPAEGSASLALREGQPEALGFYLDRERIRVGNQVTMADQLFTAWAADRAAGRDSVMLAPTRELVADLNQRARSHRLNGTSPVAVVELADGNTASCGDVIITRHNDRRLRLNATNWVKNGDRWTISAITTQGIRARHTQSGRHITLPADYVAEWAELGYATTTHTAQGVTADTCHGLLTGDETRQQAYTMLTRGRLTNNAYLVTVGDGDPHTLIHPTTINPATATDQLEGILARDESPISATTTLRQAADQARLLGAATDRYRDAIVFAAAHSTPESERLALERSTERLLPSITRADAWPALFSQLLTIAADNRDPFAALARVAADPIKAGSDPAATLAGRLDDTAHHRRANGPLPWLNPIPARLVHDPYWGAYLDARAERVRTLARQVHYAALTSPVTPTWVGDAARPPSALVADIEVWRAANNVPDTDRRPTGEHRHNGGPGRHQDRLDRRLDSIGAPALDEWAHVFARIDPNILRDTYARALATRIARLASAGIAARALLSHAAAEGPLPDDHTAAALWWRISTHLTPAVARTAQNDHHLAASWLPDLQAAIGAAAYAELSTSTWWPALVTAIEHGLHRGWTLASLTDEAPASHDGLPDAAQAWVWRITLATHPLPPEDDAIVEPANEPPDDLHVGWQPTGPVTDMVRPDEQTASRTIDEPSETDDEPIDDPDREVDRILAFEALVRQTMQPPPPSDAEIRRQQDRADASRDCPYTPERLAHINEITAQFYEARLPGSWGQPYLSERLREDITGHPGIRPGYAPDGWTTLVDHLHRQGVTDDEMLTAGVATTASTGRLIDRFRDRVVFPITHHGQVLGFVGRRNPEYPDDRQHGPKYLNTGETPLFRKGDQLYTVGDTDHGKAVLVEGPMDAIAVTIASRGSHFGAAPLGTSLTEAQARHLVELDTEPIIATDADPAGRAAAERDYWLLTPMLADPLVADLPGSSDPADLLSASGGAKLARALHDAIPATQLLIDATLPGTDDQTEVLHALHALAAAPPTRWSIDAELIAERFGMPSSIVRCVLASSVQAWNLDAQRAAASWASEQRSRTTTARQTRDNRQVAISPPQAEEQRTPHGVEHEDHGRAPLR